GTSIEEIRYNGESLPFDTAKLRRVTTGQLPEYRLSMTAGAGGVSDFQELQGQEKPRVTIETKRGGEYSASIVIGNLTLSSGRPAQIEAHVSFYEEK
ncbi:MAG: hypothetical protein ABEN55_03580, partial [Bradymonadaceae bacterium]